jgi:protein-disulfide isomerase
LTQISEKYIATGKVVYIFWNFPLPFHDQAQIASEAAECAALQGQFWAMHDMLFENQSMWSGNPDAQEVFQGFASQLGLDVSAFLTCITTHETASLIESDLAAASEIGVRATPSFIVHRWGIEGAVPFSQFEQTIEAALKELE